MERTDPVVALTGNVVIISVLKMLQGIDKPSLTFDANLLVIVIRV